MIEGAKRGGDSETKKDNLQALVLREGRYTARFILPTDEVEVRAYQAMRHEEFVAKRGWVKPSVLEPGIEVDQYDEESFHLGVFEEHQQEQILRVYLRLTPWWATCGFMLDHEFGCLRGEEAVIPLTVEGNVELSRLVYHGEQIKKHDSGSYHPLELLLKFLYKFSQGRGFTCFYIVVEPAWLKPFARRFGLRFRTVGNPFVFPDGTHTVAAAATLEELELSVEQHNRDKHIWYRRSDH